MLLERHVRIFLPYGVHFIKTRHRHWPVCQPLCLWTGGVKMVISTFETLPTPESNKSVPIFQVRRSANGTIALSAYGVAALIRVVPLDDVALRIGQRSPAEENPGLKITVLLPVIGDPAFSGYLVSSGFCQLMGVYCGEISHLAI